MNIYALEVIMLQNILAYQEIDKHLMKIENLLGSSEERKIAARAKSFLEESAKNAARMEQRAEELLGIDNFADMICDEAISTDSEGVLAFLEEKGHPALSMDPIM